MACVAGPALALHRDQQCEHHVSSDFEQPHSLSMSMPQRAPPPSYPQGQHLGDDNVEGSFSLSKTMPQARGGARGIALARLARTEELLPPTVVKADFQTLQDLIAKGIQESEEAGALFEASLGGGEWTSREEAEEAEWKKAEQKKREAEASAREKERASLRAQRRRQDEDRRSRQAEELERELLEEKRQAAQLVEQQEHQRTLCRREFDAATRIQSCYRGRVSRAGRPVLCPSRSSRWEIHARPYCDLHTLQGSLVF
eukprot:gnl/MRDRNA2_/MRDRNA2_105996_c0_seq1.p1 gnl/MRDRNA2_/MRDRNA2_105996_c0~~gnl/MRDRNA2_/MRDRNA2_105996_c0_seq1.p1  ORF type:complete len:290 (-),score=60.27 gnl/MRDRNA2_/MRDRNA2_105996_c0_seq1:218-988(-)